MTIKVGDKMPVGTFKTMTKDGPQNLTTDQLFAGKTVVLFSVPGAFTPTCDAKHLPGGRLPDDPSSIVTREADDPLLFRGDQNGVDIDAEMTAFAKNSLLYKASAQLVTSKFSGLKKAISGGGNQ